MNLQQLAEVLRPAFHHRDPAQGWERAERMARLALELRSQLDDEAADVNPDVLQALAYLALVRSDLRRSLDVRGRVEGFLVHEGWTDLQVRELLKSTEALDAPKSLSEQLVADAETLTGLGVLGFARGLMSAGFARQSLPDAIVALRRRLSARLHTRPAYARMKDLRETLRSLLDQLERAS